MYICEVRLLQNKEREDIKYRQALTLDKNVYMRYTSILMFDDGFTYSQIARALGIGEKTVQRAVEVYRTGGIEEVSKYHYVGNTPMLTDTQERVLIDELKTHLYISCKEIKDYIQRQFAVEYSISGVRKLLNRIGFVYKQTQLIPGKADLKEQSKAATELTQLIENLEETEKLFFLDGVHPTHNTSNCKGWIQKGQNYTIPANSGRQRININGAMNAQDPTEIVVDYTDSVNAQSTQRLIENILEANPSSKKIYLVSDNAKYYRNTALMEFLNKNKRLEWIFLPPYSPNLNLIERLWRFMRKEVLNGFYYDVFSKFKRAIESFFGKIQMYETELKKLMTLKFQLFDPV